MTAHIHEALKQHEFLPAVHRTDTGSIDAGLILERERDEQRDLLGPVRGDDRCQSQAGEGFAAADFVIDWHAKQATCPTGRTSSSWPPAFDNRTNAVITITFSMRDCQACEHREACSDGKRRSMTIRPQDQYEVLKAQRRRVKTSEFKQAYAKRAGVEGTISQSVRGCGVRHARSIGLPKTRLSTWQSLQPSISFASQSGWMKRHAPRPATVLLSDAPAKLPERSSYSRFASSYNNAEEPRTDGY